MIIGCVLGYFVAVTQVNQLIAPEYIAFWTSKNMPVPEPLGFAKSIISFGMLFSGIPTGLIFYSSIAKKWLTPIDIETFEWVFLLEDNNEILVGAKDTGEENCI